MHTLQRPLDAHRSTMAYDNLLCMICCVDITVAAAAEVSGVAGEVWGSSLEQPPVRHCQW